MLKNCYNAMFVVWKLKGARVVKRGASTLDSLEQVIQSEKDYVTGCGWRVVFCTRGVTSI